MSDDLSRKTSAILANERTLPAAKGALENRHPFNTSRDCTPLSLILKEGVRGILIMDTIMPCEWKRQTWRSIDARIQHAQCVGLGWRLCHTQLGQFSSGSESKLWDGSSGILFVKRGRGGARSWVTFFLEWAGFKAGGRGPVGCGACSLARFRAIGHSCLHTLMREAQLGVHIPDPCPPV